MQNNPVEPMDDPAVQHAVSSGHKLFKVFMSFFGLIFGAIGLIVLAFLWIVPAGENNGFGNPPLVFKLFASCIALAFVGFSALWVTMLWKFFPAIQTRHPLFEQLRAFHPGYMQTIHKHSTPTACPSCGAKFVLEEDNYPATCSFCGSGLSRG